MDLRIKSAGNGLIVEDCDIEHVEAGRIMVFEDEAGGVTGVQSFANFLCYLADMYGPSTGRYSEERIYIEVRPGDKFNDGAVPPPEDEL